jgi:haloalkane dehalogenase
MVRVPGALVAVAVAFSVAGPAGAAVYAPTTLDEHREHLQYAEIDGHEIAYVDEGEGPVVLLLHGIPTSSWMYRHVTLGLTLRGYRVIAPDLLGFGSSDKVEDVDEYAPDRQAARVLGLMDALGIERWTLVPHDMGGHVAWELLAVRPEAVERMVLLNTFAYERGWNPPADLGRRAKLRRLFARMLANERGARTITAAIIAEGLVDRGLCQDADLVEGYHRPIVEGADGAIVAFMSSFADIRERMPEWQQTLRGLDLPVSIVWGERDRVLRGKHLVPQFAEDLGVAEGDIHLLADGKHFVAEENAERVIAVIAGDR